jgi:hypothetical protein
LAERLALSTVRPTIVLAVLLLAQSAGSLADIAQDAEQHGDIDVNVTLDASAQGGRASAIVRIHAPREGVWSLLTNCTEALTLVPGLIDCQVLQTAPDRSWQLIRHVVHYSWYAPKLTYDFRATYDYPARLTIERVSGDLRTMSCSWYLESDGEFTVAHYSVDLVPGFWVPHWLVRIALRRDLPKMLRALRSRAEAQR